MKAVLDLYCCQGGASIGYARAGYKLYGVDIVPQPHYPFTFQCGDAIAFLYEYAEWIRLNIAFVHASPPCQLYSKTQRINDNWHPDLIDPTRDALSHVGIPWVIENVEDALTELKNPILLCGSMFGLRTYRHRLFEFSNGVAVTPPPHPIHLAPNAKMGRPPTSGENMHIVGNFSNVALARSIMEMPNASRDGLREAIPPHYTHYVATALAT
jgi:DNA (cytosine-5)-methyltransferase 1